MIGDLTTQIVSASFQTLMQVSGSGELFDGLGNPVYTLYANIDGESSTAVTSSYSFVANSALSATSASYANTSSYAVTASYTSTSSYSATSNSASFATNANKLGDKSYTTYATTGSNTFKNDQVISGSLKITDTITSEIYNLGGIIPTIYVSYDNLDTDLALFNLNTSDFPQTTFAFNYSVMNVDDTRNIRRGTVFAVCDVSQGGNQFVFEDKIDIELGDTSDVTFIFQTDYSTYNELIMGITSTTTVPLWNIRITCNLL